MTHVQTVEDVKKLYDIITRHTVGGDDVLGLKTPYIRVGSFTLFPQGSTGQSSTSTTGMTGSTTTSSRAGG